MTVPVRPDRPSWPVRYTIYAGAVLAVLLVPATLGGLVGEFFHNVGVVLDHVDGDGPVEVSPTNPPVLP